jgi:hypothetical protein
MTRHHRCPWSLPRSLQTRLNQLVTIMDWPRWKTRWLMSG